MSGRNWLASLCPNFRCLPQQCRGEGLSSKDFADGKPRMLNIFASWCLPCKAEAPFLEQIKEAGVEIHAIAIKDKPEDVAAFLAEHGNPFVRIGADMDMLIQLKLGSSGVPETYLIDGKGASFTSISATSEPNMSRRCSKS
jgi:cytochrome c biogenesis protein CcmG/thiol:disulfide interchange protein DsbE